MAKQLSDLFLEFKFNNSNFDPNKVTADMLTSKEVGPRTGPINIPSIGLNIEGISLPYDRQYQKLAENVIEIYGVDSARILTRGAVEPLQLAKRGVDRLSRFALAGTFGNNTLVGNFIRNQLNSFTTPQFPSDEVNDLPFFGISTKNGLYGSLYTGGVSNNKNALANLLTSFSTPKQIAQNIGSISTGGRVRIGGAALDTALNAGFNALQSVGSTLGLNSNRGGRSRAVSQITNPLNSDNKNTPYYPSDYARLSFGKSDGTLTGIVTGQDQLMRVDKNFYKRYEGINADKQLKTIKIDGNRFSPKYVSGRISLLNSIKPNLLFKGYLTYDDVSELGGLAKINSTSYKFFDIENVSKEDLRELKFSKNVYKQQGKGFSDLYNGKNAINTKLFAGVKRQKDLSNRELGGEKAISLDNVDNVSSKRHTSLSSEALESYETNRSDLILIYLKDVDTKDYIILMSNLTGLTDTPTPSWGEVKPIGSPNKFYFYESFEREISFKGQLYAKNEKQLYLLWQKIHLLQSLTLASSGGSNGIQGKLCELKIGKFVDSDFGFLTNCTITIPDNSPWEIQENSQVPFICEFDITYKVIPSAMIGFNEMFQSNEPIYEYNESGIPGLNFGKKLQPGNNDIKKLKGLRSFLEPDGSGEAGFERTIDASSFTGGETSTSEVPNILEPEKWRMTDSGEAPISSGLLSAYGTDTTSTLEPFDERIGTQIKTPSTPFSIGPAPDREQYLEKAKSNKKSSSGMIGGAPQ